MILIAALAYAAGTLLKHLDNCVTSSGKRLLRFWMCRPLKDAECISNRLDVVDTLAGNPELVVIIGQNLRKLPDLERLLGRVKSSAHSSCSLLMPLIGKKVLKNLVGLPYLCRNSPCLNVVWAFFFS